MSDVQLTIAVTVHSKCHLEVGHTRNDLLILQQATGNQCVAAQSRSARFR